MIRNSIGHSKHEIQRTEFRVLGLAPIQKMIFLRLEGTNCILLDTRYRVNCVRNDYMENIVILFSINSVKGKELDFNIEFNLFISRYRRFYKALIL